MSLLNQSRLAAAVRSNVTCIMRVPSMPVRQPAVVPQLSSSSRQERLGRVAVSAYEVEDQEVNEEERVGGRGGDDRQSYSFRVGDVVDGVVDGIRPFGAFIRLEGSTNGLLHISEVSAEFIDDINDHLAVGDAIRVWVKKIDRYENRISLSTKRLERNPGDFINNRQAVFDGADELAAELRQQWEERRAQREAEGGGGGDWGERRRFNDDGERPRGRGRGGGGRGRGGGGRGGGGRGRGGGDRYQERRDRYE